MSDHQANDRRVHARCANGAEVVRYDRAGKWRLEYQYPDCRPSRRLSLAQAVEYATEEGAVVQLGLPGGSAFDRKCVKVFESR